MRNNLQVYRKAKKLSQAALAARVGVDVSFISKLESGQREPHMKVAAQLAVVLDCSVGQLWQLAEDEFPGVQPVQLQAIA